MRAPGLRVVSLGTLCLLFLGLSPSLFAATATITVTATSPSTSPAGTTNLSVSVSGSGFAKGAKAVFYLTGTTNTAGVTVNSTTYSSGAKVTASITIATTATLSSFDVVVTNTTGRSGKGTKLFTVAPPPAPSACTAPPAGVTGPVNCTAGSTVPGCLDSTFGTPVSGIAPGYALTNTIETQGADDGGGGDDLVIDPSTGNIYSLGSFFAGSGASEQVTLVRYTPAGLLDTTFACNTLTYANSSCPGVAAGFNSPGIVKVPSPYNNFIAEALLQPSTDGHPLDFKILAAGWTTTPSSSLTLVLRFNSDGSLDGTFGTDGVVQIPASAGGGYAYAMALQANGNIVLVGNDVVRLTSTGALDSTFGTGGIASSSLLTLLYAVALQTSEGGTTDEPLILVAGYNVGMYRLTSAGTFDTTFGPNGTGGVVPNPCNAINGIENLAFDSSGYILAGGFIYIAATSVYPTISRYSPNGIIDTTSGFGGYNAGPGTSVLWGPGLDGGLGLRNPNPGMLVDADNNIVLTGGYFNVIRILSNGQPDPSFGTDGAVWPDIIANGQWGGRAKFDSNGKIVVAGSAQGASSWCLSNALCNGVARFLP